MNGVMGMTDLALATDLTVEQRNYLEIAKSSSEALLVVINDILDFSKMEANKLELDTIEFDVQDTIDDVMRLLAPPAHEKNIELAYAVSDDLPRRVVGDPGRLRQILINLVSNGIKFTTKGEVVLRVNCDERSGDRAIIHFTIVDTGIGIPANKLGTIFDSFSQADTSMTRRFGGTGLGLTIVSQLTSLMGGQVWVESELGVGSKVHVTLPLPVGSPCKHTAHAEPFDLAGVRVLVVDDNATNRQILAGALRGWSMLPTLVDSGPRALESLSHADVSGEPFALVLLDVQMPGMDGFEVAERIKRSPELGAATVMMLSSLDQTGDSARCREAGVSAYLMKPVRQSLLHETISALLAKRPVPKRPTVRVPERPVMKAQSGIHVLVAEDNVVNAMIAAQFLRNAGHTVTTVATGMDAIDALSQATFDLILMDVQMPVMDGLEATAAIRAGEAISGTHIPIVALTAHAMSEDRQRCLDAGADDYLAKPFSPEQLANVIGRACLLVADSRQSAASTN